MSIGVPVETEAPKQQKKYKRAISVVLVVLLLGAIAAGIIFRPLSNRDNLDQQAVANPAAEQVLKIKLSQADVSVTSRSFSPISVRVKKGESVAWVSKDRSMHLIVSDTGVVGFKGQGALLFSDMYLFTFTTPGTFTYHDQFNPSLRGTVIVE